MWARAFKCPVYTSMEDEVWLCRRPPREIGDLRLVTGDVGASKEIVKEVTAVKLGGHFPGSLVLHWENKLFIADTFWTVPVSGCLSSLSLLSESTSKLSFSAISSHCLVIAL